MTGLRMDLIKEDSGQEIVISAHLLISCRQHESIERHDKLEVANRFHADVFAENTGDSLIEGPSPIQVEVPDKLILPQIYSDHRE